MIREERLQHVLLREPRWRPQDLGQPLPPTPHANSVCLPTWLDVVDYERSDPRVISRLQTGYPRFFIHPYTEQLFADCAARFAGPGESCQLYPSRASAERCLDALRCWTGLSGHIAAWDVSGPHVACFPEAAAEAAKKHWRHAGEGISSRQAESLLQGTPAKPAHDAKLAIRQQIARLTGMQPEHIYLFGSGMSAIYTVHRAIRRVYPQRKSVQVGFPYVDTLKLQTGYGPGAHFIPRGDKQGLQQLDDLLNSEPISALFCEFPSNPLLVSPDLAALAERAGRHGVPLVVDETLATYVNADLSSVADVLITSLTKYFSGSGDVLAGAAILNPRSPRYDVLRNAMAGEYEDTLWGGDAELLARHAADFTPRVQRINRTAEQFCDYCRGQPAIEAVYYPKYSTPANFAAFQRSGGGYGGLCSLLLANPERNAPRFFENLRVSKGPNLGTDFTLACPFTLLAHFDELEWAESCGVSRYLIRISIGLEEPQDLIARVAEALGSL